MTVASRMKAASRKLRRDVAAMRFGAPVTHVYNPLDYAAACNQAYIDAYAQDTKHVVFLGMNPGPYGMAQTGVPFGEVNFVRDWLGIEAKIKKPDPEHPKRLVEGFACTRSEVSGKRLWGWAAERFGTAPTLLGETLLLEQIDGHVMVGQLVEAFSKRINSISLGKPTLEDVFIHETGHRFWEDA